MLAVEMTNITKRFPGMIANDQVDLKVVKGEIHCLLGENGAGKSTLMKVLFGLYKPEEGTIRINGQEYDNLDPNRATEIGIGMVHQHFMLIDNLTVLENIILGREPGKGMRIDHKLARTQLAKLAEQYGFTLRLDVKVKELSVGEKQRVEIMKTLYRGADIIILDEPTAVLTPLEVDQLMKVLKDIRKQGKTIIFITHKLKETMQVSDQVTVLRNGKLVANVRTEETTEQALANLMVGEPISFEIIKSDGATTEESIFSLRDVKLTEMAENLTSLEIRGGEILGIAGVDGNGQKELEALIIGLKKCEGGKITMCGEDITESSPRQRRRMGMAYIPSDRWKHGVINNFTIKENFLIGNQFREEYSKNGFLNNAYLEKRSNEIMTDFDVRAVNIDQTIGSLSGGNQQKLVLGREVSTDPVLVLACQPTRGLDIGAIKYIEHILLKLRSDGKAVLLISTDLTDLFQLSDRIAVLFKGEIIDVRKAEEYTNESISLLMAGKKDHYDQKNQD